MRSPLLGRGLLIVVLAATSIVAGSGQRSFGDTFVPSVTIDQPHNHAVLGTYTNQYGLPDSYSDVTVFEVTATANGSDQDPPRRVRFFVDNQSDPSATEECQSTSDCSVGWQWDGTHLFGWHTITAEAEMTDPLQPRVRSDPVRVFWRGRTHLTVHRDRHAVIHHKMIESGRVINRSAGHRGASHALVKLIVQPGSGRRHHVVKVRANAHGHYRAKFRATRGAYVTAGVMPSRQYLPYSKRYFQPVSALPRCRLSKHRVQVKKPSILMCRYPHLPIGSKFHVQERIHGHWLQGKLFYSDRVGRTKLYITPFKRRTLVLRERFSDNAIWKTSYSNAVRLHVR